MYKKRKDKTYSPATRKWIARAFRDKRFRVKRFLVSYEAIVDGEPIVDALYVLASNENEALRKARNLVLSFHPKARSVAVAIKEEQTLWRRNRGRANRS